MELLRICLNINGVCDMAKIKSSECLFADVVMQGKENVKQRQKYGGNMEHMKYEHGKTQHSKKWNKSTTCWHLRHQLIEWTGVGGYTVFMQDKKIK